MFSKLWAKLSGRQHNEVQKQSGFRAPDDRPQEELEQLNSKIASMYQMGRYDEAIEYAMRSVELTRDAVGEEHPELATNLNNLARLYRETGNYAAAEPLFRQAIEIRRIALGEAHPDFAQALNNLALLYDLIGDYAKAEPLYLQASDVVRRAQGDTHPDFAITLNNLAMLYCAMSKYRAAEPLLRQALEIIGVALGGKHPHFATTLNNLATLYHHTGNYASAMQPYEEAMEIRRASLGEQHPDFAASLNNLAQLYGAMGNYAAAEPYLRQSLEIVRSMLGEAHPDFALALSNLALHYHSIGDYVVAEPLFREALEIRRRALGEVHPDFAMSLNNLAMLYVSMSDYAAAEPLLRQALETTRIALGTGHPNFATNASNLAHLYGSKSDHAEAERNSLRATEVRRTALGELHPDFATSLNNQARLYHQMGNYAAAGPLFRQATEILRVALGEQHPDFAGSLNNLAWFYRDTGDYTAAVPLLLQATEITRKALGVAHRDVAQSLNNLALVYDSMGDYAAAEPLFEQALEIWRVALGERHPDFAKSLNNIAMLYLSTGDHAAAEPLFKQAMEIFRSALGERHPDFAASVSNLGLLHQSNGDHAAAEPLFEQAVEILRDAVGEQHPHFATILVNLASSFAATGRVADARTLMEQALEIHDRIIGQVFAISSEDQRWAYLDSIRIDHDRFLSLVSQHLSHSPEAVRAAFSLVLRRKGITAEAVATQRDAVLRGRYPDVAPKLRELTTLRGQIARKALAGAGREGRQPHQQSLVVWNARRERLESEIARLVPEMNLEQELRAIDHRVVAMAIPVGATLIEFVSFFVCDFKAVSARGDRDWQPARYLAFVMPAGEPENVEMIDLGDAELIDRSIAVFRSSILALKGAPDEEAGIRLRDAIFTPLMGAIGHRKRLLIAPDVDLSRLPFEVLPLDNGRRLIDEYRISYLGAGRDVVRFKVGSNRAPARSLVVADPDFDLSTNTVLDEAVASAGRRSFDLKSIRMHFDRLLGTRIEGESIAAMLDAELWTAGAALDGHLKKCQSPRILHIATHGFFLEDATRDPYESRSALDSMSVSESGMDRLGRSRVENPLLRSGLVLAGFNTWLKQGELMEDAEDGLLTADDAAGLDLLDTELVVLSACETGLGDVSVGEGVFGLRRAFVLAGARTLVMSLWKVPDEQTQELMEDFYRRMLGTDGKLPQPRAEALRDAQLAVKARHPQPFYWGAFICQGYDGVLAG